MPQVMRPAMSDYGVPSDLAGALEWSWADERLTRCRNYWIVTVDGHGHPHATPVWGLWESAEERFWFSCAPSSLKARNLARNQNVVVAVDDSVEVVSMEGVARLVDVGDRAVAQAYAAKYEADRDKQAEMVEFVLAHTMFCVTPVKALGIIERIDEFQLSATRWVW